MVVNPINSNDNQFNAMAFNTAAQQKLERSNEELPPKVIEKKDDVSSAREEIPREEVEKAAEKLNRLMGLIDKKMEFEVHEKSHRVMVKVIDREKGEVLREIPPKKILDMLSSFAEFAGLLVDQEV